MIASERTTPPDGVLVLAATPIGNLADATPRLTAELARADVIAAEDTRRLRRLCAAFEVELSGPVVSYFEGNEAVRTGELVTRLLAGARVLLVTDAGMPSVSDPGYRLVAAAAAAGIAVTALPGPSAVTTALAVSGLPCDRFCFEGFLPRRPGERRARLVELADETRTLVVFEAPHRLAAMLGAMSEVFGADRLAAVCRELTKTYEEVRRGGLAELAGWAEAGVRGEVTVVVAGAPPLGAGAAGRVEAEPARLALAVAEREAAGQDRKAAVADVARQAGVPKRVVFDALVAAKHAAPSPPPTPGFAAIPAATRRRKPEQRREPDPAERAELAHYAGGVPPARHVLTAVAWPYASGPRHIGHVAGFGVPSDVFSRYQRLVGNKVLMVSGTDEHGTPILVAADQEGIGPREIADRYNLMIAEDLRALGLSYDLFTRTTTRNHHAVAQDVFATLHRNGYVFAKTTLSAISPSTGRTLPDRYIEGTCPICGYDGARGDQCDNCGNQLDPQDLINPRSRINGEKPSFVESEHFFLDLPAFAERLGSWLQSRTDWRPNVLKFSLNLLDELKPRAYTRDIDWGVPVPLPGWRDRPDKRIYVWFDAVVGYLSASIEWARRSGDPDAWRPWWQGPDAAAYYFMGKDNVVFHTVIWPALLLGYDGEGAHGGSPGPLGRLELPTEVVSSEFLTMEARKFSSSRGVGILVRDFLARYDADALRYYLSAAGPENQDTDFTWSEFVRRTNDELVAAWGNLVNRTVSFTAKNLGAIPPAGELREVDRALLAAGRAAFGTVGAELERSHVKAAIGAAMRLVSEANKYLSDQAPWQLRSSDPARMATVCHVALQLIDDAKTLLTPFLPSSSDQVYRLLGGQGTWAGMPQLRDVDEEGGPSYAVLTGDYETGARWESRPIRVGTPLAAPTPIFRKLDVGIVDEELARLEATADER